MKEMKENRIENNIIYNNYNNNMSDSNINNKLIKSKIHNNNTNNYKNNKMIIGRYRNMMSIFNANKGNVKSQECGSC